MITPGQAPLDALRAVMAGEALELPPGWEGPMRASCDALAARLAAGDTMYGVNTGFGKLASTRISDPDLVQLQLNLIRSHAAGVGEPLPDAVVRLVLALKALSLARGASAAQPSTVEALLALLNGNVLPVIPARGSVGASGDLAPLAHLSLVLIGEGQAMELGATVPGAVALKRLGLKPLALGPKEGLALLNGTQVSTALALAGHFAAEDLWRTALVSGALSTEGARGSDTPFDPRIHALRGQEGQIRSAAILRALMAGSTIRDSHRDNDPRVQDPYSLRCQPQVMGACLDTLEHVAKVLAREANAVTDNPLVTEDGDVLSGGNFHAEPVAFAADHLALVLAEIGALAERRIALLVDPVLSGLPAFLVREGGLNSGFMIAQVTAAALVAENRALATPRSVDSLPTSANQEDHVSMATGAGLRLAQMARNLTDILAIELLCGAQAVEFHRPLQSSPALERAHALVRGVAEPWERDRQMAPDIAAVSRLIQKGGFAGLCPAV
ncbi:Histidine ammonia-lyase [Roseomonas mucosa]|uniref:Histidine ammonia-lyase n=1 Tax=Roseomonas mucosa TaxID=207340 RepID=A0A379N529_9PROT|nr:MULTISPECIES: histidine ammonia-lyase [Roseomonas]MBS5901321.1 histidine ammonia-lyase [Acetobacteraceae bacterium]MCG7351382.1 histidine ammonia-lyase [Roseomonas mucosa]MCG7358882.1 histidine ammonia-lyase [Roseomonas mucosa]MDT8288353.1 histidine ammonia-lyase [Roseomonas mucosa]MDT8292724.1 histidine ammonia-lyase [Roseomonas mucosa]